MVKVKLIGNNGHSFKIKYNDAVFEIFLWKYSAYIKEEASGLEFSVPYYLIEDYIRRYDEIKDKLARLNVIRTGRIREKWIVKLLTGQYNPKSIEISRKIAIGYARNNLFHLWVFSNIDWKPIYSNGYYPIAGFYTEKDNRLFIKTDHWNRRFFYIFTEDMKLYEANISQDFKIESLTETQENIFRDKIFEDIDDKWKKKIKIFDMISQL